MLLEGDIRERSIAFTMDWKKNFPLIVGRALPVIMVLLIAGSIVLPRLFAHPRYGFLYTWGEYTVRQSFVVKNGQLTSVRTTDAYILRNSSEEMQRLFRYDPVKDASEEIPYAAAQKLKVSDTAQSPDGYEVQQGDSNYSGGFFSEIFFSGGSRDYNAIVLSGHGAMKRINVARPDNMSPYNFHFVGWVLP